MVNSNKLNVRISFDDKSVGKFLWKLTDVPNKAFIHVRSTKVGANKYNKIINSKYNAGNKSNRNVKNRISDTNIIEPGKPKKTNKLIRLIKKSFGHTKLRPLTSVINRVLKRRAMASTNKNEFVDNRAWLMSIQKPDKISDDWPLMTQIVNQCISTTVE